MSESPERATNLEELKAEIDEGLEGAKKLVKKARLLLSGDGNLGEAEQA